MPRSLYSNTCTASITLPPGDDDLSNRIKGIKIRFMRAVAPQDWHPRVVHTERRTGNFATPFLGPHDRDEGAPFDYEKFNAITLLSGGLLEGVSNRNLLLRMAFI